MIFWKFTFIIIWILDLFFYSNTEIFLIFAISSTLAIFSALTFSTYIDYLNELIVEENKDIYTLVYILRYKFSALLYIVNGGKSISIVTPISNKEGYNNIWVHIISFITIYSSILSNKSRYLEYLKFFKFVKNSLNIISALEFLKIKELILINFSNLSNNFLNLSSETCTINSVHTHSQAEFSSIFITWYVKGLNPLIIIPNFTEDFTLYFVNNLPVFLALDK